MGRLDYEIKKMRKKKDKYELPLDFPFWNYETQLELAKHYKQVMLKHTIFKSRMFYGTLMLLWLPWALVHWSIVIGGAFAWAFWGSVNEQQIIDRFEKI